MRVHFKAPLFILLALAGLAGTAHPVEAQGLGAVARKEEERRKDIKAPAKVYTNRDLAAVPDGPAPGTVSSSAGTTPAPAPAAADAKADAKDKEKSTTQKDQAYWSGRKKELQAKLDSDQTLAEAMQTRINVLTADFSSRSDPVQRAGVERDRNKALAELDRLHKAVDDGKKALAALDEDARKAGVPAGWLR